MKLSKLILVCVCFAGLTQLVWSQNSNLGTAHGSRAHGVPGYLDPRTGTFTAKVHADPQASASPDITYSVRSGTFTFTLPVTIKSTIASGDVLVCEIDLGTFDPATLDYSEYARVAVTSPTASSKCTVTIPYEWVLTNLTGPDPDLVTISYTVSLIQAYTVGSGSGALTAAESSRETSHTYSDSEPVPANGAATNITIGDIVI